VKIELSLKQIRSILWLMEDAAAVIALPQFAHMRAAKETLQKALNDSTSENGEPL
jgi:hypothetical protein